MPHEEVLFWKQTQVDNANKHGILLDMVQVLTDLDLIISKSYICSDGGWFMDERGDVLLLQHHHSIFLIPSHNHTIVLWK
ncbi:hypothetical protein ACHQM5_020303 [Ranunculus cassubicifolius]